MYKVSNTKKFINDYYNEETIELGKEFHFVPGESAFEENSARILDYIMDIYEIQETLGKSYYSNLFKRQELVLSKKMLQKLLDLSENIECDINIYGKEFKDIRIEKGNPDLSIEMILKDNALSLKKIGENKLISLCEDGSILFYNNTLYMPPVKGFYLSFAFCRFICHFLCRMVMRLSLEMKIRTVLWKKYFLY